jgi:hypothetical protein
MAIAVGIDNAAERRRIKKATPSGWLEESLREGGKADQAQPFWLIDST